MRLPKEHTIQVRLTLHEKLLLEYEARRIGVTLSELIRNYIKIPTYEETK